MKIAKNIKTILCDDVRHEVGGKMSLMGIYSKHIILNKIPAILPTISLVVMLEGLKKPFERVFVSVIMTESEPIKVSYPAPPEIKIGQGVNLVLSLSPFMLQNTGPAKFEIRFIKGGRASIVHDFSIMVSEQP